MAKTTSDVQIKGRVIEALPNTLFRVEIDGGKVILCTIAGKLRIHRIRIITGDTVTVVPDPYGPKGRIVFRG